MSADIRADSLSETILSDEYLSAAGFTGLDRLRGTFTRMLAGEPERVAAFKQFLPHFLAALSEAADPERVLVSFERFLGRFTDPLPVLWVLAGNPRAVEILVVLFAGSQFLTEILLRNPDAFERLVAYRQLSRPKSVEQLYNEAQLALGGVENFNDQLDALRRFQSWEMLRIGTCDLLDLYDLPAVTRQLSNLADAMIRMCLKLAAVQAGGDSHQLTVLGMGKLGGRELNYSSDIDLLFISRDENIELGQRIGERLIDALARATGEGFLYRVDMRLRPWGRVGPLVSSVKGFLTYLTQNARLWEKQALLKARVIAGNHELGRSLLESVRPHLFGSTLPELQQAVFNMKHRTEIQLRQSGRIWGEVKLGEGSIRDIEFTVQFLQLAYGVTHPEILSANTLDALVRLAAAELIRVEEYRILTEGYLFLRTIEHYLQMMDYRQTHSLPEDSSALIALARRLRFSGEKPGEKFLERYTQHINAIRAIYLRYVGGVEMTQMPDGSQTPDSKGNDPFQLHRHIDRMSPSYSELYSTEEIAVHASLAARLNEDTPVVIHAQPAHGATWRVTVVAYDFPGELSVISGLMVVHGLNILEGEVFTYEPLPGQAEQVNRQKIVDVFTVEPVEGVTLQPETWTQYAADLTLCQRMVRSGRRSEMQGELTRRVATTLRQREKRGAVAGVVPTLYPVEIEIDNEANDTHTVLRIDGQDTVGFLYELTNALAVSGIYIHRMTIETVGNRVKDVLFVTDRNGQKIERPDKQRELRAAVVLIKHFTHLLPYSPNPESALVHFRDFTETLFRQPDWPDELISLQRPEVLHALARVLGVSDFLWDDFLRMQYTNLFPVVTDMDALQTAKSRKQLEAELARALRHVHAGPQTPSENAPWIDLLTAWRDREMFRIDMRHILGHTREFWDFAAELTDLAEVVTNVTYHLCHEDLRLVYGTPHRADGGICEMSVVALGKFGGQEMGFASDVELVFIYEENGETDGPKKISTAEFYENLVVAFVGAMRARREGIFEVDLQLRPYGKAGSLAVSLDSFKRYFAPQGPAWAYERQALVKLRAVAGNEALGHQIEKLRDEFVYTGEPFDVTAMRAMRERQLRHLVQGGLFNLKYSLGGLVDVEYLVQGLQITYGARLPEVRHTNTREAMARLARAGILSQEDYRRLRKAHTFLRWLIDSLRVVRGNARDVTVPPVNSEEFAFLARRLHYADPATLASELQRYTEDVREINARLLR
ncbi:MAG TPA: glutamine synthetase adenylyltransferase [Anaerolinea thermolimosa]|uniref:Glutamine synthetase adenylyltransferase n=1 Tax=Anaerolinea thermolimosa TaxID=229919 RepID=A0A3D1JDI6_9CHLR|nr:glutamine synthetase adenylyltransferase [Anaerolinea thermolimosa]